MILILGGTSEARELAQALGARAILSLAGATKHPAVTPQRSGGFGGVTGLKRYLKEQKITRIIDATHPFAAQISANTVAAAGDSPLLRLTRPAWPNDTGWQQVNTLTDAAATLPTDARVFLSVGAGSLRPFLHRNDVWFLVRSIEPPLQTPPRCKVILQRPPFELANEINLMRHHRITHLVSKNAGGYATRDKLSAAKSLNLPVIMVNRPKLPLALTVETVEQALNWCA